MRRPLLSAKALLAGITATMCSAVPASHAANWTGTTGNWSSDGNPGWNGTGVPNAQGAVAEYLGGSSATVTQDILAGVTVGTIRSGGAANASFSLTLTNGITLDQDGAGSGSALIENARTAVGGLRLNLTGGTITLADDVIIRNTSNSTSASGGINITSHFSGVGTITFDNVSSNNPAQNQIALSNSSSASNFTGNVLVRNGAVSFNHQNWFGNQATNVITLGESGQGSTTLTSTTTVGTVSNNIVSAAGTSGTNLLGSTSTAGSGNTTYSGSVLLAGNLSLTSANTGSGHVTLSGIVSGNGSLTKTGAGIARLGGVNTYTGDTTVSAGTLLLLAGSEQRFVIEDGNVSNQILGTGALDMNGTLRLDISGLTAISGAWNLVDVASLNETWGGSFAVAFVGGPSFTSDGFGNYTSGDWTFSQSTGALTLVPEPGAVGLLSLGGLAILLFRRRAPLA